MMLGIVLAAVLVAGPGVHHDAVTGPDCTSYYSWSQGLHDLEWGTQAHWTSNPCGFTMQVRTKCTNAAGADYYVYSGEVHGVNIEDWATCDLFDNNDHGWIDRQDTNSWYQLY